MATLKAMFKLFDGYSTTVNKIIAGTDKAAAAVGKASKDTDIYNQKLKSTGASASAASTGLTKLIGTVVSLAAAQKAMSLTDTYTNTSARLSMITGSLEEQKALQGEVFAAADRSRGSYVEMANATAKMKMLAGDAFGSNEEALGFTELLQKSLKVSGASQGEQNSAFLQLTQAMASGKLQGDEFRSIMENAPMVANAISQYLGVTKGELKELSSDGAITADIIKNAMFNAADDINGKFAQMPMTFADVWTKIKNTGMQAFGEVFEKVNAMLNSDMGQAAIMNLTGLVYMAAAGFDALLDGIGWVGDYLDILAPIVLGLAGAWLVYNATAGIAWLTTLKNVAAMALKATADWAEYAAIFMLIWAQEGFNAALAACPITWIIGVVILLIAAFYAGVAAVNHFAGTSVSATGLIGGAFGFLAANLFNIFVFPIWNGLAMLGNFLGNVFTKPKAAVQMLFLNMAKTCIDYVINMAKAIENIINKIPGVTVDITSGLEGFKSGIESKMESIKDESGWKEYIKQPELMDVSTITAKGYKKGAELGNKASNFLSGFVPDLGGNDKGWDQFATGGNPAVVKGTGKGGAMKVEKDDKEDIEWMRKLAERDYVARIAQNTLAPNIKVEFSGPITKEADTDGVMSHVVEQLKDVIATAPEGVPA
ncbi:tape measure protein [Enterocloster clostridioformis]|uniref:tape measure protein n=1 Tax=Enterocloster clostridioformis TaxID=1531 RepID=UPI00232FEFFD|nr:tape measure protein [Enterocloster clostridioformis]MDB2135500.1 tape measure protein [Enterocloster clostridioformis]